MKTFENDVSDLMDIHIAVEKEYYELLKAMAVEEQRTIRGQAIFLLKKMLDSVRNNRRKSFVS